MAAAGATPAKPLRTDAERNRAAILAAAATVYAEHGCETSLEDVAKFAGVGVGTVYRRFPNKNVLIEALLEGAMGRYAQLTEDAAQRSQAEPWQAFRAHVLDLVDMQAKDRAFSEVISDPRGASAAFRDYHRRALRASLKLVANAQAAGVLRPDFQHRDLLLLTHATHGVVIAGTSTNASDFSRLAELLLESFRRS